jgi:hypothetical protein
MKRQIMLMAGVSMMALLTASPVVRAAQTEVTTLTTQAAQTDTLTTTRGEAAVSGKISADFRTFAGSTANANALVGGLRSGSPITLTSTNPQGATSSTTFTAPTGKMGYGNVFISLSLAQQQLVNAGITQPTAQQIQASLLGGTVTTDAGQTVKLSGVAQMRSDGMGWGQIANTLGFKLGPVVSGIKSANANVAAQPVSTAGGAAAGANAAHTRSGIVSGTGAAAASASVSAGTGQGNAYGRGIVSGTGAQAAGNVGNGQGNAYGRGIVSATGGSVGVGSAAGGSTGQGNAYGRGIVTGAGSSGAASGNSAAQGRGK